VSGHKTRTSPPAHKTPAATFGGIRPPPGDAGIWIFIIADVFLFGFLFNIFIWERLGNVALFERSRRRLDSNVGLINTLFLLTSSWFMVGAVRAAREGRRDALLRFLVLSLLAGSGFAVSKLCEYAHKAQAGISMLTNDFFTYYFVLTGLHFFHFVIGMIVLGIVWSRARCGPLNGRCVVWIESGASYWHMVDLLWLAIFPLLYLLRT